MSDDFDPVAYWRQRMLAAPELTGTGTRGLALAWQHTLYAAKRRAVERAVADHGIAVAGGSVLDLGCGTGFFEDVWEDHGAARVAGIDLVPELVEDLAARHPEREYEAVDLSDPEAATSLQGFDLVTALDVLYHVVDDTALERLLDRLLDPAVAHRWLLLTDDLRGGRPWRHVRFRHADEWRDRLARHGFVVRGTVPVYVLHNRYNRVDWWLPGAMGRARGAVDRLLLPLAPGRANMRVLVAERREHR